jgi:hypothetical protein
VDFAEAFFLDCQLNPWMMRRKALVQKENRKLVMGICIEKALYRRKTKAVERGQGN